MSYDIQLLDRYGNPFKLKTPLKEGGIYEIGGNRETNLNITYNYSWYYYMFLDKNKGIRALYGKKAKNCKKILEKAIAPCENCKPNKDYWAETPGNCIIPLKIFLDWCNNFPDGVFKGD